MKPTKTSRFAFLLLMLCVLGTLFEISTDTNSAAADETLLIQKQTAVTSRYQRLEELLLRLADVEAAENPERSALLRRAARQSRDKFVLEKLRKASDSLRTQKYQQAVDSQGAAAEELQAMLKLLMSEDRSKRIRDEKDRIANIIKDLKRIEGAQRSARARTENGADLQEVQGEQKSITDRSEDVKNRIQDDEGQPFGEKDADQKSGEQKSGEQKSGEQKSGEQKSGEQKSGEQKSGEQKSGEQKSGEQKSGEQKSGEQKSGEQKSGEQKPKTPEQAAEQQLQKAIEKMKQAQEQLKQANRKDATENQREAEENLRQAIDRLERILRQLREEEMQRELARLESRLRKMAAMQSKVLDDTVALAATPIQQRSRQIDLKAGDLAFEEKKITLEADRAMLLLREEGSSVAFPEVLDQIRSDTRVVSERLAETKIDVVTQGIQRDILAALEEMIAATQKAQRDLEKKQQQQQQQQQQQGQQGEQPLVQALAELKLIRTMETRIKSTTERYAGLIEAEGTVEDEVTPLLQNLAERQNRLYRVTRDLVLKRNK